MAGLRVVGGLQEVTASWNTISGTIDGYTVSIRETGSTRVVNSKDLASTSSSYQFTNLQSFTSYDVLVAVRCMGGAVGAESRGVAVTSKTGRSCGDGVCERGVVGGVVVTERTGISSW